MNTLTFLNSPLLWGLGLASIPILIHLLYRRQYRRVDWAPMRYLKLSIQRNRRRIRLEQLLLLLLRTLAVLLLFFLVARPVMHAEGFSRWLGTSGRTNRIVVLDDSLSMGYTHQGQSALARAQQVLADLLPTFDAKDGFTLLLTSAPREPLVREVELDKLDDLTAIVRGVRASDVLSAWEPTLRAVDELLASGSYPIYEVTLVTDLRRAGWEERLDELTGRWAGQQVRLRVFDVSAADTANVALLGLEQADHLALVATPTRFEAEVRNDSGGTLAALEANWIVDGKASLIKVPELAAGQTLKLPLLTTFQDAGSHDVAFDLTSDSLLGDNRRSLAVDVRPNLDVMLVDGEPSAEPLGSETDFLALALSLSGDATDAFRVEILADSEWASATGPAPDVLVLAGVSRLTADQVELLERRVSEGMGLMIFVSDQTDPDNFNQLLYKGGAGLLPALLESITDTEFSGILVEPAAGSPLESLGQLTPAALQRIKVRKTFEVRLPAEPVDGVRVLARWNNQAAGSAVLQKVFGAGNVLLWTISADRGWSDWPTEASYVLAVRESARALARSDPRFRPYTAGQALQALVPASHDITDPAVKVPDGQDPRPAVLTRPPGTQNPGAESTLSFADTRHAGLYAMSWRDSATGPMSQAFAVNPDRRESDLARYEVPEFKQHLEPLAVEVIALGPQADTTLAVNGREIWRMLATCLMGLLVFEACFARWAGRPR